MHGFMLNSSSLFIYLYSVRLLFSLTHNRCLKCLKEQITITTVKTSLSIDAVHKMNGTLHCFYVCLSE